MAFARTAALIVLLFVPAIASAQTGQTAQIPLQFDFLNPGARSLGLGSAFVAVADDATAAFTNPAGLMLAVRPFEVGAEVRYRWLNTPYLSMGRLSGTPSGQLLDKFDKPVYGVSVDSAIRPYFLSLVFKKQKWVYAGYRHELVLQTNSFVSQGPFYKANGIFNNSRLFGLTGYRDIRLTTYGAAAAYRVSPRLSIGQGISVYRFSLDARFASLGFQGEEFGSPVDLNTAGTLSTTTQVGTGTQVAFNIGALISPYPWLRIGLVFRQSASFLFDVVNVVPNTPTATRHGVFRTPGVLAAGVRIQRGNALALMVDYDWVQYANLTTTFITFQVDPSAASRVSIASGHEVHFGGEYTLLGLPKQPTVRAGAWFDPNHAVRYESDGSGSDIDTRFQAIFPGGRSVWHYCFGVGLPLSRTFEANIGADLTSERKYASASLVARFGKQ